MFICMITHIQPLDVRTVYLQSVLHVLSGLNIYYPVYGVDKILKKSNAVLELHYIL